MIQIPRLGNIVMWNRNFFFMVPVPTFDKFRFRLLTGYSCLRTFVIPFYYGSGSATAKRYRYDSYGSGSGTLNITGAAVLGNLRRYWYLLHLSVSISIYYSIYTVNNLNTYRKSG